MSMTKRIMEQISNKLGFGGEITPEVEKAFQNWMEHELDKAKDRAKYGDE